MARINPLRRRRRSDIPDSDDAPPSLLDNVEDRVETAAEGRSTEAERRRLLAQLGARVLGAFMLTVALLYWAIASLLGSGIFVPRDAESVLRSAQSPDHYAWSSESVRRATLGGKERRQDSYRSAVVDLKLNKSQVVTLGVFPERTLFVSDGRLTTRLTDSDQRSGRGWRLVTDACKRKPPVPAAAVQMPTPEELTKASPKLISDNSSVFGERAWVLSFVPTRTILRKMLWVDYFNRATTADRASREWVLPSNDRKALLSGKVKLDYAYAWVSRDKPRYLRQIEVRFFTNNSKTDGYRFLVKMYPQQNRPLSGISFGRPDCNASRVGERGNDFGGQGGGGAVDRGPQPNAPQTRAPRNRGQSGASAAPDFTP